MMFGIRIKTLRPPYGYVVLVRSPRYSRARGYWKIVRTVAK